MRLLTGLFLGMLVCWCLTPALATVTAASVFGDNMVLQQGQPVPVWGTASPGEQVLVSYDWQTEITTAGADGKWQVTLGAMRPTSNPEDMIISGDNTLRFSNVLVGEVWVCSGQSNMEFTVGDSSREGGVKNAQQEIAAADFPQIRMFSVDKTPSPTPLERCGGTWEVCGPKTVAGFSAVGYFYARELYNTLHVPIGMIHASLGNTPAEMWTSLPALKALPLFRERAGKFEKVLDDYLGNKDRGTWQYQNPPGTPAGELGSLFSAEPAALYNGMIAPLIPYAIRGAIWYQGENNAGAPDEYRQLLPGMITCWRKAWNEGDFPFAFVQLANFRDVQQKPIETGSWAELREAQLLTLKLPNTGMAVSTDIGDARDIHPKNKQDVGKRLALAMLATVYGKKLEYSGPLFRRMKVKGAQATLTFDHADGLLAADSANAKAGTLLGFAIAGADKVFHVAAARIEGKTVVVSADKVPHPVAVRYAWANNPVSNLYNAAGLPASSFRTDEWSPQEVKAADEQIEP